MYKNCPTNSECLAELLLKLKKQKEILQNNNLKGPKSLAMPFTDSGDMYVVPNAFQKGTQSSISAFKIKSRILAVPKMKLTFALAMKFLI